MIFGAFAVMFSASQRTSSIFARVLIEMNDMKFKLNNCKVLTFNYDDCYEMNTFS